MKTNNPLIGVILGSDSDYEVMKPCFETLQKFEIPFEAKIISAHRTPDKAIEYATTAKKRGLKVIIAAAGAAAHLAGTFASSTTLPIIGVPLAATSLQGIDALLSTVQMPAGVPVAAVAIGQPGAANAVIFAAQIIATYDSAMNEKLEKFKAELQVKVSNKNEKLQKLLNNNE